MKKGRLRLLKKIEISLSVIALLLLLCAGCNYNDQEQYVDFDIISPKANRIYYTNEKILFSTNLKTSNLEWTSSIDGFLGNESSQFIILTKGNHEIHLKNKRSKITKSIQINVEEKMDYQKEWHLLTSLPQQIILKYDINNFGFCSLSGSCKNLKTQITDSLTDTDILTLKHESFINRDLNFRFNKNVKKFENTATFRSAIKSILLEEDSFYVINTANQNEFHQIKGIKYYSDKNVAIYVEKDFFEKNNCTEKLDICINNLNTIILPRLKFLWGECADVDNNGVMTILFSSTINTEKTAVGFFYPNDLFTLDNNTVNNTYNPYSNEKDIIYLAFPTEEDSNYSTGSICATLAHEMTHAINFSKRVVFPLINNEEPLEQIDTFLDEGLSHLTESLCGFGDSGGNSNFVNFYLENSAYYSFCKNDLYGSSDSIGQRGAVSLFLYYLFEKAGGISWDNDTFQMLDTGGISFLKSIVKSSKPSWQSIGEAFGKPTDFLFLDFAKNLLENNIIDTKTDPVTNENIFSHGELKAYESEISFNLLEYSILKLNKSIKMKNTIEIDGDKLSGTIYFMGL